MAESVEVEVAALTVQVKMMADGLTRMEKKLDRICASMHGNGRAGCLTRLDRVEQWKRSRLWFERAMLIAVTSLLVRAVYGFLCSVK